MNKIMISAAFVAAVLPAAAFAQSVPSATILVVDTQKAATECTACRTALTQLQSQGQGVQTLRQQLGTPLQTEGQSIQQAINALNGKQPDAALQSRITAFRTKQQQAEAQLAQRAQQVERNQAYVLKQIDDKMGPAIDAVQARRRANLVVDRSSVLRASAQLDVTAEVIAELNRSLTSIGTTAPAQPQAPQGR